MTDSKFGEISGSLRDARKVVRGITRIADALKPALGPMGRTVTVAMPDGSQRETRHGSVIVDGVRFSDPWSDAAGSLLRQAGNYAELAGGGITPVALISQSLVKDLARIIAAGVDEREAQRGIEIAAQRVLAELTAQSQRLRSVDQLGQVGTVAADGDAEVGGAVVQAIQQVRSPGAIVTIVDAAGGTTDFDLTTTQRFLPPAQRIKPLAPSRWLDVGAAQLKERGKVTVIRVDGATPGDMEERRYRVEAAFRAALAAAAEGVVAGGGSALIHAGEVLQDLKGENSAQQAGIDVVRRAISMPLRQLVKNAGRDSAAVVRSLRRKANVRFGYDVEKNSYVDMFDSGVIDPVRAAKTTVAGAASLASEFMGLPLKPFDFRTRNLRYFLPADELGAFQKGAEVSSTSDATFSAGDGAASSEPTEPFEKDPSKQPPRFLTGHLPEQLALNEVATLTVQITQQATDGATTEIDLQVPKCGLRIAILVDCLGFELLSPDRAEIELPQVGDSTLAAFRLKVLPGGRHSVRVSAFNGGTAIGGLNIPVEIVEERASGNAPFSQPMKAPLNDSTAKDGEVTLAIPTSGLILWEDKHGKRDPVPQNKPLKELRDEVRDQVEKIADVARKTYKATPDLAENALKNAGIALWRDLIPAPIQELFYKHHQEIKRLKIWSAGDFIPWEMLYPFRADPKFDYGFLCEQVQISRWVYGPNPPPGISLTRTDFVAPNKDLTTVETEIGTLTELFANSGLASDRVEDAAKLYKLFSGKTVNVLHFACHNSQDGQGPHISINQVPVIPDNFNEFEGALKPDSMVFMNACGSDTTVARYTTIDGWARCFLSTGVGAFIGTLWEVRDATASAFAKELYSAMVDGLSFGDALQRTRANVREASRGDPTWLAYTFYGDSAAKLSK